NERAQHCGGEQQRKRGRLRRRTPATGDDRGCGDELVVQRAELADGLAYWKARPRVEAHRSRPVMDRIPDLPEVIPRVVTAEIHLPVDEEILPVACADPEHERDEGEKQRNVIPRLDDIERCVGKREAFGESFPAL